MDGSPFTGDVNLGTQNSANWATYLTGTLGAGGKGYFVLDVTKPGTTDGLISSNFTKTNASTLVVMDKTDAVDDDIGHIFGTPVVDEANPQRALQITQTNNGRWAVIMGNGYNSINERPVLLIQYLTATRNSRKSLPSPSPIPRMWKQIRMVYPLHSSLTSMEIAFRISSMQEICVEISEIRHLQQ